MGSLISDLIIILILLIVLFFSVKGAVSHFRGEGSCCGGGSEVRTKPGKLDRVVSVKVLKIDGMYCKHCYARVANVLNSMDGVNATVYGKKERLSLSSGKTYLMMISSG